MPAKPKALPPAPDPKRVNLSAEKLVSQALDLLASEGDTTLYANPLYNGSNQSSPDTVRSAGIPFVRGKTMLDAQKFRVNWYGCERRTLGKITRLVCERNWFASSVLKINKGLYGSGFRFADPAAQAWEIFNSPSFKKTSPTPRTSLPLGASSSFTQARPSSSYPPSFPPTPPSPRKTLLHQQTNLGHMLKAYGSYRDRIIGSVVGVGVGNLQRCGGPQKIADSVDAAQYLDCVAVFYKMAEGVAAMLGNHTSSRQKQSVSIEAGTSMRAATAGWADRVGE